MCSQDINKDINKNDNLYSDTNLEDVDYKKYEHLFKNRCNESKLLVIPDFDILAAFVDKKIKILFAKT